MTLCDSRHAYAEIVWDQKVETWLRCHRNAFEFFGGVPKEVLFDNAKSIILERDAYGLGEHRWNPCLVDFAKTYGFVPKVCRPYRAKTKGKVERFNRYLKSSFVIPLQATLRTAGLALDVATANGYIGRWLTMVANARVHGTTGDIPNERLLLEQEHLLPLPMWVGNGDPVSLEHVFPIPIESLQHPLSLYDQLFGVSA